MSLKVEAMILPSSDIIWVELEKYWDYYRGHPSPQAEVVSTQVIPYFEGFISPLQSIYNISHGMQSFTIYEVCFYFVLYILLLAIHNHPKRMFFIMWPITKKNRKTNERNHNEATKILQKNN